MRFVLDNSVAMRWRFAGRADHVAYAQAILGRLETDAGLVPVVPPLWHIEAANAILFVKTGKKRVKRDITEADIVEFREFLLAQGIETDGDLQTVYGNRVLSLAREYALSAYDAAYLDLALQQGLPLATNDEDLARAAVAAGIPLFLGGCAAYA